MRYKADHKEQTRDQILDAAARVFRQHGLAGTSVSQIMGQAGLTVGGFYAHFDSKDALFADAIPRAFDGAVKARLATINEDAPDFGSQLTASYLSADHCTDIANSCPMSALANDISRTGTDEVALDTCIREFAQLLTPDDPQPDVETQDAALAITALCVGGITLARATNDANLAERLLAACREASKTLIANPC